MVWVPAFAGMMSVSHNWFEALIPLAAVERAHRLGNRRGLHAHCHHAGEQVDHALPVVGEAISVEPGRDSRIARLAVPLCPVVGNAKHLAILRRAIAALAPSRNMVRFHFAEPPDFALVRGMPDGA